MVPTKQLLVTLAAALLTALCVTPPGAATAATVRTDRTDPASWTMRTAPSRYGDGRPSFGYTVNAGDTLRDGIEIANAGTDPLTLDLYAADAFTTEAGRLDVRPRDQAPADVGTWVHPAARTVSVGAGQRVRVPFSVAVPADAAAGDHVGGIVAVPDQEPAGATGGTDRRSWIGIKVRVSGDVTPHLEVESTELDLDGTSNPFGTGRATIGYTVRNAGNTVLSGLTRVTVSGALGLAAMTSDGPRLPALLPGERWSGRIRVGAVHARLWDTGELTVTPVLTDAAGSTSTLRPVTASDRSIVSAWSVVVLVVLLLVLVLLAATAAWLARRLVTRRRTAEGPGEDEVTASAQ